MNLDAAPSFLRRLKKFGPNEKAAVTEALERLVAHPRDARLKTHKLTGNLKDSWSCSAGYDLRIVFDWQGDTVTLLDVGTHDEVY